MIARKIRNKLEISALTMSIQYYTVHSSQCNQAREINNRYSDCKERFKIGFINKWHVKHPTESFFKSYQNSYELSKITRYYINI